MKVLQYNFTLPPFSRGFHLITDLIEQQIIELPDIKAGIVHIFILHTSASLTINENADLTVRQDFESHFNKMIPENAPYYLHNYEGTDDMPAHLKASVLGNAVSLPVQKGKLLLGTWQGIYLGEHRDYAVGRKINVTVMGNTF